MLERCSGGVIDAESQRVERNGVTTGLRGIEDQLEVRRFNHTDLAKGKPSSSATLLNVITSDTSTLLLDLWPPHVC